MTSETALPGEEKGMNETAWLAEVPPHGPFRPAYYVGGTRKNIDFSTDVNKAMRFARKVDVETAISTLNLLGCEAREHSWLLSAAPSAPAASVEEIPELTDEQFSAVRKSVADINAPDHKRTIIASATPSPVSADIEAPAPADDANPKWIDVSLETVPKDGRLYRVKNETDRGFVWWSSADDAYGWVAEGDHLDPGNITHWAEFEGREENERLTAQVAEAHKLRDYLMEDGAKLERELAEERAKGERMRAALRSYGCHRADCNLSREWRKNDDCDCGLATLLDSSR